MIMFKNGKVLFVNNKIAMDPACCCGSACCGRPAPGSGEPNALPLTLTLTLSDLVNCSCSAGIVVTLTWDSMNKYWEGTAPGPSTPGCAIKEGTFRLLCGQFDRSDCESFGLLVVAPLVCINTMAQAKPGCSCNPLSLEFDLTVTGLGCCSLMAAGDIRAVVTE